MTRSHLIMVPCHGIWDPEQRSANAVLPAGEPVEEWHLAPFQIPTKDNMSFMHHAKIAIDEYNRDSENSVLVFSGGFTKLGVQQSEARSYLELCLARGWLTRESSNVLCEEHARDSYENVLFSVLKFRKAIGTYPDKYTIVGFEFKKHRFINQHVAVLQFENVEYLTYGPVFPDDYDYSGFDSIQEGQDVFFKDLEESEYKFAVKPFDEFRFGQGGSVLKKRLSRDPYNKGLENYFDGNSVPGDEVLKKLLYLSGPESDKVYDSDIKGKFPWCHKQS